MTDVYMYTYTKQFYYFSKSYTLREEHRLRVFESRVLRITCGPKRKEWNRDSSVVSTGLQAG
jgi:hypothetical protein